MISTSTSGLRLRWYALVATAFLVSTPAPIAAVEFVPLGHLTRSDRFRQSWANGVSGDGRVVVGESGRRAFRWTAEEGMVGLDQLPGGGFESRANAASFNGSVIVGRASTGDGGYAAFRWTKEEGMVALPYPEERRTEAVDVSADGTVIVGQDGHALLWTQVEGLIRLPDPGECFCWDAVQPSAISADGSVVVGDAWITSTFSPYRWIDGIGADQFVTTNHALLVRNTSGDGSMIVGTTDDQDGTYNAFSWTESEGLVLMPPPPGMNLSYALATSIEGNIIAGSIGLYSDYAYLESINAAVWDEQREWRRIEDILKSGGVDLMGWHLSTVGDISADGRVVVGRGINPDGDTEAWMAVIPEPSTLAMCLPLAVIGALLVRRKSACWRRR